MIDSRDTRTQAPPPGQLQAPAQQQQQQQQQPWLNIGRDRGGFRGERRKHGSRRAYDAAGPGPP
jgi:hypothetical protein